MEEKINTKHNLPSNLADNNKLNKLRAAVLGANDGIVSVSSIVMGVSGATSDAKVISLAGLAALIAGALSMAVGEYVSVGSQADYERTHLGGVVHSPWQAALASLWAFTVGGIVPMLAVWFVTAEWRLLATVALVIVALVVVGLLSAIAGNANKLRAVTRVVAGGAIAMAITYGVGLIFGVTAG